MLKKTSNTLLALLFVSTAIFLQDCSGSSSSNGLNDTIFLASGVKYLYLEKGDGPKIDSMSHVSTHINLIVGGDTVWSTYNEGEQIFEFDAKRTSLIAGFDEVVMYGREGDRILAIIPPELGYGERGSGAEVPPNSTLQFDLNMVKVDAPKVFISDVLYPVYEESGIVAMIDYFKTLEVDSTTHRLEIGEWYDLSRRLMQAEDYQSVVTLWDYKLKDVSGLQGYYIKALSHVNLEQIQEAIATLEDGIATATDTTNIGFVKSYLDQLQTEN